MLLRCSPSAFPVPRRFSASYQLARWEHRTKCVGARPLLMRRGMGLGTVPVRPANRNPWLAQTCCERWRPPLALGGVPNSLNDIDTRRGLMSAAGWARLGNYLFPNLMSLAVLYSRAISGMHAPLVTVEVHLGGGLPSFTIVGLPDSRSEGSEGPRARGAAERALRFSRPPHHCQPGAGGPAQGRRALRLADRAGNPGGVRPAAQRQSWSATSLPASSRSPASCARYAERWR